MEREIVNKLSHARFEKAEECLASARALTNTADYRGAANRLYYAIFHAMRAVLAYNGVDMRNHGGIIGEFRRLYIKNNLLDKELSQTITDLFDIRTDSDYEDFFVISKEEILLQTSRAEAFLIAIKAYLDTLQ